MHRQKEKAGEIGKMIELSKAKRNAPWRDSKAIQADLKWGTSQFLGKLLFEATVAPNTYISDQQLRALHKDYQAEVETVDLEDLIDKFWIRIIGNVVEIPRIIYRAAERYEEIRESKSEFDFLTEAKENFRAKNGIDKVAFMQFHADAEKRSGKAISLEKCRSLHFMREKDGQVTVMNVRHHKPLFRFGKELSFIHFINERKKEGNFYQMSIAENIMNSVFENQRILFPGMPSLQELEIQQVIKKGDCAYYINFLSVEPDYWRELGSKIGAVLWDYLKTSGKYPNPDALVIEWALKMRFIDQLNRSPLFLDTDNRTFLLDTCSSILFRQGDLLGSATEIDRLVLSEQRGDFMLLSDDLRNRYPELGKAVSEFQLFQLLEECNEAYHNDLLWMQDNRWLVDDLIGLIVFYDNGVGENGELFPRIYALLTKSIDRPYMLWQTCFYIYYWRPEIIPHLCLNSKIASLAFALYLNSETDSVFPHQASVELSQKIQCDIFSLLLSVLNYSNNLTDSDKSRTVFECLHLIAKKKILVYGNNETDLNIKKRKYFESVFGEMIKLLKTQTTPGMIHDASGYYQKRMFPQLLPDLFQQIQHSNSGILYHEGVIGLPLIKLELFSLMLDLVTTQEYRAQAKHIPSLEDKTLLEAFVRLYCQAMNTLSIKRWNYESKQLEESIPLWSTQQEGLDLIPWEKWALFLEGESLFPRFLQPGSLKLQQTAEKSSKFNDFSVDKIRTHLAILFLTHQRLRENQFSYKQQGFRAKQAISRLELTISDLIDLYSEQDGLSAKADIFEDRFERTILGSQRHALLPIIAKALNKFEAGAKERILKSLVKNDSLTRCLKLLEFLSSEADIRFIKTQIKDFSVAEYLDTKNYIPEIEAVVTKLAEFNEFIDKAKEALAYWKDRVIAKRDNMEYQITYYRIKLLIAYYEEDEDMILLETPPAVDSFSTSSGFEFKPPETRDFYLGLVKLKKDDPNTAYTIFNRGITSSKNDKPALAINRFYAHIGMAVKKDDIEDKEKSLTAALSEWEQFENSLPQDRREEILEYIKENIWINKLNAYHELQRGLEFDRLFDTLDKHYQLRKDFFELRVKNLIARQHYEQAKQRVQESKQYHQLKDGTLPDFVNAAAEKLEDEEDYKRLRKEYQNLITRSPQKLVEILPENLAIKRTLSYYVLNEIASTANDLLDTINSLEEINNEDKYTDLIMLGLQSKFRNWYWKVGNSRGGFSDSSKANNGELDFVVTSANNERIATCEALLLHGKNTHLVTSHTIKTFNYDHRRKLFFVIAYYNGKEFDKHWIDYKDTIIPAIKYPLGFPLSGAVEEIKESFVNNSIKVVLARHGDDTEVYHLAINVNYKVTR